MGPTRREKDNAMTNGFGMAQSNPSKYQFVNITPSRGHDAATQKLIRKHVMKDIGKARRRKKGPLQYVFVLRDDSDSALIHEDPTKITVTDTKGVERSGVLDNAPYPTDPNVSRAIVGSSASPISTIGTRLAGPTTMLGAGRVDPFAAYPIKMNRNLHGLIDHC